jgi:diguanylate cyclase (GGDEF)-like protein/PAS domain S-box-containing protein
LNNIGLVYISPGFYRIVGANQDSFPEEWKDLAALIHPEEAPEYRALFQRILQGQVPHSSAVLRFKQVNGTFVWIEMFVVPVMDGHGNIIGMDGLVRDVSEHLQVAELLSQRSLELSALLDAQKALVGNLDFEETLQSIAGQTHRLLESKLSVIFLLDDEAQYLQPQALASSLDIEPDSLRLLVGEGVSGWVAAKGRSQLVNKVSEDPRSQQLNHQLGSDASLMVVPLIIADEVAGALTVVGAVDQYDQSHLNFLESLAQVASLALANSQSFSLIARRAALDGLTGAHNRLFLEDNLETELNRADKMGYPLAVLMVDVDNLKDINDEHGHLAGDRLLIHLVSVLKQKTRETDWVARFGGDEFVVILPGCPEAVLNRLGQQIREGIEEGTAPLPYSVSLGGAVRQPGAGSASELLRRADEAERSMKSDERQLRFDQDN